MLYTYNIYNSGKNCFKIFKKIAVLNELIWKGCQDIYRAAGMLICVRSKGMCCSKCSPRHSPSLWRHRNTLRRLPQQRGTEWLGTERQGDLLFTVRPSLLLEFGTMIVGYFGENIFN